MANFPNAVEQPLPTGTTATGVAETLNPNFRTYEILDKTEFGIQPLTFVNRVFDTVANGFVRWRTLQAADPTGQSYPGPGVFAVNTSDYCVESRIPG